MTKEQRLRAMLTLQFIPYVDMERLSSDARVDKLLRIAKEGKVILLEGKLRPHEEAALISKTMASIDEHFKGIEISPINVEHKEDQAFFRKVHHMLLNLLLGDRRGLTIIGPATIVKEIKQDPDKIQLLTEDVGAKKRK
jgi:hypothetical protein